MYANVHRQTQKHNSRTDTNHMSCSCHENIPAKQKTRSPAVKSRHLRIVCVCVCVCVCVLEMESEGERGRARERIMCEYVCMYTYATRRIPSVLNIADFKVLTEFDFKLCYGLFHAQLLRYKCNIGACLYEVCTCIFVCFT